MNTFDADSDPDASDFRPAASPAELRGLLTWDALKELVRDATGFVAAQHADLTRAAEQREWADLGHDFALSRAGHGTGFWDRGLGDVGDRLHRAAKVYSGDGLYLTGGRVHAC
ncbi:hypothetical protein [Amycolatopsis jejuensis]|uniref:hypothetical protein n=1 Tax=Amycolatopsis jejuensis TaxID=330084 RepID=UPI000ABBC8C1|nr:hypothetical protein [Amycolatopsis jejuensis]